MEQTQIESSSGATPKRLNILDLESYSYSSAVEAVDKEHPLPEIDKSIIIEDKRRVDAWLFSCDNLMGKPINEQSDEELARFILMQRDIMTQLSQAQRTKFSKRVENQLESIKADHKANKSVTAKDIINRPRTKTTKVKPCKSGALLLREKLTEAYEIHCKECSHCLLASKGHTIERTLDADEKLKQFQKKANEGIISKEFKSLRNYVTAFDLHIEGWMSLNFEELKLAVARAEGHK